MLKYFGKILELMFDLVTVRQLHGEIEKKTEALQMLIAEIIKLR